MHVRKAVRCQIDWHQINYLHTVRVWLPNVSCANIQCSPSQPPASWFTELKWSVVRFDAKTFFFSQPAKIPPSVSLNVLLRLGVLFGLRWVPEENIKSNVTHRFLFIPHKLHVWLNMHNVWFNFRWCAFWICAGHRSKWVMLCGTESKVTESSVNTETFGQSVHYSGWNVLGNVCVVMRSKILSGPWFIHT